MTHTSLLWSSDRSIGSGDEKVKFTAVYFVGQQHFSDREVIEWLNSTTFSENKKRVSIAITITTTDCLDPFEVEGHCCCCLPNLLW